VILKKCPPLFSGVTTPRQASQIASHAPSETIKPSFNSSPWILGAPQPGFSCAKRRISTRISSLIFGRPMRGRERHRQ
jgi:hypothetical protein